MAEDTLIPNEQTPLIWINPERMGETPALGVPGGGGDRGGDVVEDIRTTGFRRPSVPHYVRHFQNQSSLFS